VSRSTGAGLYITVPVALFQGADLPLTMLMALFRFARSVHLGVGDLLPAVGTP
jgi:hypothetical protein